MKNTKTAEKMYAGCYRLRHPKVSKMFAQVKRGTVDKGRYWIIELRNSETGNLLRFAGSCSTLEDALNDAFESLAKEVFA